MDTDSRPHRSNNNTTTTTTNSINNSNSSTSELFICFTSRLSSSSMKISSKSILSPGRTREPSQISLSSSLSRRLRSNGSMKGGQASPMFPTNGKKKGCAFENPEPSSPKVTCIGQVRVKTKKQGKKIRARSKRRGEVSFRKVEQQNNTNTNTNTSSNNNNIEVSNYQFQQQECLPHRNQRWVHLPMTICEALRTFGAEFNCFLPCKSSCMASEREKEEKTAGSSGNGSSCGAVFARWLVAVQEGEEKAREIELVVGEEDREENVMRSSQRRHVFEGIDIGEFEEGKCEETSEIVEQEEAKVSICVPPKNALLLMRCRSDPVRMAALANRFWECPVPQDEDCNNDDEEKEKGNEEGEDLQRKVEEHVIEEEICENSEEEKEEKIPLVVVVVEQENEQESPRDELVHVNEVQETDLENQEEDEDKEETNEVEEIVVSDSLHEDNIVGHEENEDFHQEQNEPIHEEQEQEQEVVDDDNIDDMIASFSTSSLESEEQEDTEAVAEDSTTTTTTTTTTTETTHEGSEPENPKAHESEPVLKSKERETSVLPDCLLLMMCEPKLSMEVSKETWVCSTDFIRWPPERPPPPQPQQQQQQQQQQQKPVVNKKDGSDEPKKRLSIDSNPAQSFQLQPPRSSCSFPAAPPMVAVAAHGAGGAASMTTMIEQKLVGSKAYEPFVLTRCKSEPMRSAAKLAPEACFWKNRKLEPHRPATLGVGAAGVGF